MGLIPVNSIPTPSFAWLATRPIAEKCDSESVIVSANLPPIGKGLSVLTKHPDRLSVRTRATIVRPDSRSVSSTAPPKWWRGARRGLASRTVSISGIAVSSKHAQPISSYSRVCEIFHTVLCRALRAYDSEIRGAGILGQRSAGKPSARGRPARGTRGTGTPACARFADLVAQSSLFLRRNVYLLAANVYLQDDLRGVNKVELSPLNKVSGPGAFVAPPSRRPTWHRHSCLCALCCHSEERAALVAATRKCPSMRRLCACWGGEIPGSFRSAGLQPGILGLASNETEVPPGAA